MNKETLADSIINKIKNNEILDTFESETEKDIFEYNLAYDFARANVFNSNIHATGRFKFIKRIISKFSRFIVRQQMVNILELVRVQNNIIIKNQKVIAELSHSIKDLRNKYECLNNN